MSSIRNKFLNKLTRELDHQPGVECMLWRLSYSFMTLIYCCREEDKHLLDLHQDELIIYKNLESETFSLLMKYGFLKDFKTKKFKKDKEVHYIWERVRDKEHPHGEVEIFSTDLYKRIQYGHDEAGSCWRREYGSSTWELVNYADLSIYCSFSYIKNSSYC